MAILAAAAAYAAAKAAINGSGLWRRAVAAVASARFWRASTGRRDRCGGETAWRRGGVRRFGSSFRLVFSARCITPTHRLVALEVFGHIILHILCDADP